MLGGTWWAPPLESAHATHAESHLVTRPRVCLSRGPWVPRGRRMRSSERSTEPRLNLGVVGLRKSAPHRVSHSGGVQRARVTERKVGHAEVIGASC